MRKHVKNQLLTMLSTLCEGIEYVADCHMKDQTVLADCHSVIQIVEQTLQGSLSRQRFNQYRTYLDKIEKMLNYSVSETISEIKGQIKLLEVNLCKETEINLEIVFMPYNVSMWDSLESIWLAARSDPQCEVYVIPIPYCNRNQDGSAGEIHYDGSRFPEYVDVTHYDAYDLEARRPDVIYIHNPYDEFNYVTSVHPRFYSAELKKYTDMLVYVPYFVVGESIADSFCAVSAVRYVDRIIAQSETVRQSFAKYIHKSKVVSLGSPKVDKVINTKREEQVLPKEWTDIISNRKVVLYNTHLKNVMIHNGGFIAKLKNVFDIFRKKEDIVLWWRPHPLAIDTIKSMNPGLLQEYSDLVAWYKSEEFGIYDDTENLHRAISISDAYYGDPSSLIYLYYATGKPILMQEVRKLSVPILPNVLQMPLRDFAIRDHFIWFITVYGNGLFRMDMNNYAVEYIGGIPGGNAYDKLYTALTISGDDIILTPCDGANIIKYSIRDNNFISIPVKDNSRMKFCAACSYGKDLYMIPYGYRSIVKYDIISNNIKENLRVCQELDDFNPSERPGYFMRGGIAVGEGWLMLAGVRNILVKYYLQSGRYSFYPVDAEDNDYLCIAYADEHYWLFPREGNIIKWNEKTGATEKLKDYPAGFQAGSDGSFADTVVFGRYIYAFPFRANMVLRIDSQTNEIESFIDLRNESGSEYYPYIGARIVGNIIYAIPFYENTLQKINPQTGEIEKVQLIMSEREYTKFNDRPLFSDLDIPKCAYENQVVTLEFFLKHSNMGGVVALNEQSVRAHSDYCNKLFTNADGSCGRKTHEYIKSTISTL